MKNKNIISSVVGAGFFAVGYLGLSLALPPALLLGATSFVASELIINGAKKEEIKELTFKDRIIDAKNKIKHIKDMINSVDDTDVQKDLEEITKTSSKIINTIEKNNMKNKTVTKFLDYYLPICVKIVDRYDDIENQSLTSKDSKKFMEDSKKIISDTNSAFKKILNSLYQSDILNADAEMKVYNSILKSDGYEESLLEGDEDE